MLRMTLLATLFAGAALSAGEVEKHVSFKLDEWVELKASDGPVTLHRMRIVRQKGGLTKSTFMRPGNDEFLETIQIQIEYSNSATRDWEAKLDIDWEDGNGKVIDGYKDEENIDSEENHEKITVTLSTLAYGLEKARKLNVVIRFDPD